MAVTKLLHLFTPYSYVGAPVQPPSLRAQVSSLLMLAAPRQQIQDSVAVWLFLHPDASMVTSLVPSPRSIVSTHVAHSFSHVYMQLPGCNRCLHGAWAGGR